MSQSFVEQMAARVRRHMLVSGGGVLGSIGLAAAVLLGARAIYGEAPPDIVGLVTLAPALLVPVIGLGSTLVNLRCPSCNHLVAGQVSWNYSVFSSIASKTCSRCGEQIFGDRTGANIGTFLTMAALGALIFAAAIYAGLGG